VPEIQDRAEVPSFFVQKTGIYFFVSWQMDFMGQPTTINFTPKNIKIPCYFRFQPGDILFF